MLQYVSDVPRWFIIQTAMPKYKFCTILKSSNSIHSTHTFLKRQKNGLLNYLLCFHRRHRGVSFNNYFYPSCWVRKRLLYQSTIMISQNVGQNIFAKLWAVTFAKLRHSYFLFTVIKIKKTSKIWFYLKPKKSALATT